MTSLTVPSNPLSPPVNRRPDAKPEIVRTHRKPNSRPETGAEQSNALTVKERVSIIIDTSKVKGRERGNRKISSRKAVVTNAVIEEKRRPSKSKEPLPRTLLEDLLHEHIAALRWESALNVFEQQREQLWYRPDSDIYIKLIVMLGKCKQPEKAHSLFQAMIDEGCGVNHESYTAILSAYSRNGLFDEAFSLLEEMNNTTDCKPDVHTYTILIKSCLQVLAFDKVDSLLSVMASQGIKPNTITYTTLIDVYGKARKFAKIEAMLVEMLREGQCEHDVWTMNSTLRAFGSSGQIEKMEKCYDKFQLAGIQPTIETFNVLLDSYGKTGNYEKMFAVIEYMQKYYFSWTLVTYNIVIDAFGRAGNLKQMELLFRSMRSDRVKPNCVTLCSLVRAYGKARKAEKILGVLHFIENADVKLDIVFFNCLVDAYGKMGCFMEMKGVLEMMERKGCKPDGITYRTMIKAYTKGGMTSHAKELKGFFASVHKSSTGLERQNQRQSFQV